MKNKRNISSSNYVQFKNVSFAEQNKVSLNKKFEVNTLFYANSVTRG